MDFQILPNWSKKVGLSIFIFFELIAGLDSFMDGLTKVPSGTHHYFRDFFGETLYSLIYALPLIGLLNYMMSKEKVEDDYIQLIRLQSYQITIVLLILLSLGIVLFNITFQVNLGNLLSLFMILFLIIFYFKKRVEQ